MSVYKETLTCGDCGEDFIGEGWRDDDGPCVDDKWYCVGCMIANKCGCLPTESSPALRVCFDCNDPRTINCCAMDFCASCLKDHKENEHDNRVVRKL